MPRVIRWFNIDDDWVAGSKILPDVTIEALKEIFPDSKNDPPMYLCYEITKKEADSFKQYADIEFEFDKYVYFAEFDADKE